MRAQKCRCESRVSLRDEANLILLSASQKYVEPALSRVPIISGTGIGKLILLFRKLKDQARELKIKAINDNLYDMFASINLDRMLKIERN